MVVGDSDFIYVLNEKVYILHHQDLNQLTSYSNAPLSALADAVFLRKESAIKYAQFYTQNANDFAAQLLDKTTKMQGYIKERQYEISKALRKANYASVAW